VVRGIEAIEESLEDPIVNGLHLQEPDRHEPPRQLGIENVRNMTACGRFPDLKPVCALDEPLVEAPDEAPIPVELVEDSLDDAMAFVCHTDSQRPRSTFKWDRRGGPDLIVFSSDALQRVEHLQRRA